MKPNLTPQQAAVLAEFKELYDLSTVDNRVRVMPTIKQVADSLGLSPPTVHEHVDALCQKGYMERRGKSRRRLYIVPEKPCPLCGKEKKR